MTMLKMKLAYHHIVILTKPDRLPPRLSTSSIYEEKRRDVSVGSEARPAPRHPCPSPHQTPGEALHSALSRLAARTRERGRNEGAAPAPVLSHRLDLRHPSRQAGLQRRIADRLPQVDQMRDFV